MKLFLLFILCCFVAGILLQKRGYKTRLSMMFGLALLVSVGYFFFNQI
jgi:uncharacterized membrane protein YfcA